MSIIALVDGDIVAYRCAAANDKEDVGIAVWQADQMVTRILSETQADGWEIYLSGENNFRYQIFPDYKANRRDQPKPRHLERIREELVTLWGATICDGYEADDALGIYQSNSGHDVVYICSIDKDLLQIPGQHYNFVKREFKEVDAFGGAVQFYTQLLCGDPTDNIRGCPGVGKVKAERALKGCLTERQLYERCIGCYKVVYKDDWEKELTLCANLLYILRSENDVWSPPKLNVNS